jgi:hypothetical protein
MMDLTWPKRIDSSHVWVTLRNGRQKMESPDIFGQRHKRPKMFRTGLYARVSTNDQQTIAMQSPAMRDYAARRGWTARRRGIDVIDSVGP